MVPSALPKVCISGCTSSCSGHQAAAIGFQGTVKAVPGGKPAPAFAIFLLLGALGIANMWWAVFADVGVMILAVLNAMRMLIVEKN